MDREMREQLLRTEAKIGDGPYMLALPDGKGDFVMCSDALHKELGCFLYSTSRKANMVADALSRKERLKMIMSLGELIRDFEKMEIEVKGVQDEGFKDNLRGFTNRKDQECSSWITNGDYVTSLKDFDTASMDSDEVVERKMLGPAVVQRTGDIIDLIRGRWKCNPDARQIGAYERLNMQPDLTYMEQPVRVIDRKGTSA
ncbi:hypothetical protein AgCh_027703 [Apium graveolens]